MSNRRLAIRASAALMAAAAFLCSPAVRAQADPAAPQADPVTPQAIEALAARATFHTDMTFDESMLHAASQIMPDEDRPIIAKLRSISVHEFRYSAPGLYDPAALEGLRMQFYGNGWNHLVTKQSAPRAVVSTDPETGLTVAHAEPQADPMRTDVWVRMNHADFDGAVVMVANQRNVNVIVIDGMLSPLDLLHLRGHFGIPRFSAQGYEQSPQ